MSVLRSKNPHRVYLLVFQARFGLPSHLGPVRVRFCAGVRALHENLQRMRRPTFGGEVLTARCRCVLQNLGLWVEQEALRQIHTRASQIL